MPLPKLRDDVQYDYKMFNKNINNLVYMDDLKIFEKIDQQLQCLLAIAKQFSDGILKQFIHDNCVKANTIRGRMIETSNINHVQDLELVENYRYLKLSVMGRGEYQKSMLLQRKGNA